MLSSVLGESRRQAGGDLGSLLGSERGTNLASITHQDTSNVQPSLPAEFRGYPAPRSEFAVALLLAIKRLPHSGNGTEQDGRRKMMRDILGNDVPWYTVRDWIRGRRHAPQWARERVAAVLEKQNAAIVHQLAIMHLIPVQQVKIRDISR